MEIGLYNFAELIPDPLSGYAPQPAERLRDLVEEAELADQVGLDVFAVGEHHRADFAASAPAVVLAAIAMRTRSIRLSSAVTVLSSEDPVRVFQQFSTLDLLSGGRAEIMAGRGSFIESFPLFGFELDDYESLFSEKLDLLLKLRDDAPLTWSGQHRAPMVGQSVYPRPLQNPLPVWVGVGGNPESAVRAGRLGLPMAVAIIGGMPERFAPLIELYREAGHKAGHDPARLQVSVNSHGFIGDDSQRVADETYPSYAAIMNQLGRERGWPPTNRGQYDAGRSRRGAIVMGSPQEVIDKIMFQHSVLQHDRFLLYPGFGALPHAKVMRAIELLGTVVAPAIRQATGSPVLSRAG